MSVRPIIFSAPMVRALLEGRKTQTRRIWKNQPTEWRPVHYGDLHGYNKVGELDPDVPAGWGPCDDDGVGYATPYAPGDLLYVREAGYFAPNCVAYAATNEALAKGERVEGFGRLRPSIHMPRWASRLTLAVTDVRVQRLNEIGEEDAVAEGVYFKQPTAEDLEWWRQYAEAEGFDPKAQPMQGVWCAPGTRQGFGATKEQREQEEWGPSAAYAFRSLWNSLHGRAAWDLNPWVVAITFDVHKINVDHFLRPGKMKEVETT